MTYTDEAAIARSADGGRTWTRLAVRGRPGWRAIDVSFADRLHGVVIEEGHTASDIRLVQTSDGGKRWSVVSTAGPRTIEAALALRGRVLVAGRRGLFSSRSGHRLRRLGGRTTGLSDFSSSGRTVVAYGRRRALMSRNAARSWRRFRLPHTQAVINLDVVSARTVFAVTRQGATWGTRDGGRSWRRLVGAGPFPASQVDFVDGRTGFLDVSQPIRYADPGGFDGTARLLRTDDGGASWRSQFRLGENRIASVLALDRRRAALAIGQDLAVTTSGGDGPIHHRLRLNRASRTVRPGASVRLSGAIGGDRRRVTVARRAGGRWQARTVITDAGGRFSTSWEVSRRSVFVVQVDGTSLYRGAATKAFAVGVRR